MTDMNSFIADFMVWLAQFVAVSTVLIVATHLFARKRRAQKQQEAQRAEEQGTVSEQPVEEPEAVAAR